MTTSRFLVVTALICSAGLAAAQTTRTVPGQYPTIAGAIIKNNIIRGNRVFDQWNRFVGYGAGIWAEAGVLIQGNLITANDAGTNSVSVACGLCGASGVRPMGGGVFCNGRGLFADNVITRNTCLMTAVVADNFDMVNTIVADNQTGGVGSLGLAGRGRNRVTNCTVVRNAGLGVQNLFLGPSGGPIDVVNSIVQ